MPEHSTLLNQDALLAALGEDAQRFTCTVHESCTSTNTELAKMPWAPDTLHVLACNTQTEGRGRRGRTWYAQPGQSLIFSLAWCFQAAPHLPAALPLVIGLALAKACHALGAPKVQVKWPNDLRIGEDKLAGVLIELSQQATWQRAVIGVGFNLLPPEAELNQSATGLFTHLPSPPDRHTVLANLLRSIAHYLDLYARYGFAPLKTEWQTMDAFQDKMVTLSNDSQSHTGHYMGVSDEGALMLQTSAGLQTFFAGDLSLRSSTCTP